MKKGWIIFATAGVGLLGYGLYHYFSIQSKLLKAYDYKIISIKIKKFDISQTTVDFVLRFINKSDIEATIKDLYLDIFIENQKAGYVTNNNRFILPANGSSDIPLSFTFSPKLLINNIVSILLTGSRKKDLEFELSGFADIESGFIKKTIKINFKDVISAYIGSDKTSR